MVRSRVTGRQDLFQQIGAPWVASRSSEGRTRACRPERRGPFCQLVEQTICSVGILHGIRAGELDDFAQDAWLAVLNSLSSGQFDPRAGTLQDWLFIVIRNRAVTTFRHRCNMENRLVDLRLESIAGTQSEDPSAILDRWNNIEVVRAALAVLRQRISDTAYQVFSLRHLQEISSVEVAARLGLSKMQVRVYDLRARRKLAKILRQDAFQ